MNSLSRLIRRLVPRRPRGGSMLSVVAGLVVLAGAAMPAIAQTHDAEDVSLSGGWVGRVLLRPDGGFRRCLVEQATPSGSMAFGINRFHQVEVMFAFDGMPDKERGWETRSVLKTDTGITYPMTATRMSEYFLNDPWDGHELLDDLERAGTMTITMDAGRISVGLDGFGEAYGWLVDCAAKRVSVEMIDPFSPSGGKPPSSRTASTGEAPRPSAAPPSPRPETRALSPPTGSSDDPRVASFVRPLFERGPMGRFTIVSEFDKPDDLKRGEVVWTDGTTIGVGSIDDQGDSIETVRALTLAKGAKHCEGRFASAMDSDRELENGTPLPRLAYACAKPDATSYHVISFYLRPNDDVIVVRHFGDTRADAKSGDDDFFAAYQSYRRGI